MVRLWPRSLFAFPLLDQGDSAALVSPAVRAILKASAWIAVLATATSIGPLRAAPADARTPKKIAPVPLQIRYQGTVELEAHFRRPGETRPFRSEQRFYTDGRGRVRLDWSSGTESDTTWAPETYLVVDDSVYHRDAPDARWRLLAGRKEHEARLQAYAGFPAEIDRGARPLKVAEHRERIAKAARPDLFVERWAHPRLGDVRDSILYHLALIEFAVGSSNGERLADAARRRWPQKPIRYALFSHYHPHYAGGLRAMIAEGATVVTTPGNEAFVRRVADLPFTIEPDRLARSPRPLTIQTFPARFELADSTNQLVALNYGDRSQHTDEFVVFWFPRARLLFETELGWVRAADGKLRAIRRAAPLLAWLDDQKLGVDRIVQSWPMRGNAPEVSRAGLDSLVQAAKK